MFGRRIDTNVVGADVSQGNRKRQVEKKSRFGDLTAEDEVRMRTVRTDTQLCYCNTEADRLIRDTTCQATNCENLSPNSVNSNRENYLASTQRWRNLLFSDEDQDAPLVASEKIFRENFNMLLSGVDECASKPNQWSREDTNYFYNKILSFVDSWKRQLMEEKDKMDLESLLLKGKFENKHDLVTNRINMLTSVFYESVSYMKFSKLQKKGVQTHFKELNDVRNKFGESKMLVSSESSLVLELKNKNLELIEARKQADGFWEELSKIQSGLKETNLIQMKTALKKFTEFQRKAMQIKVPGLNDVRGILTESGQLVKSEPSLATNLKNKDYELNEAKKRADEYREELRKTQDSLKAHLKLKDVIHLMHTNNNQPTQVDQQGRLNKSLQNTEKQLDELQKLFDCGVKKQMDTEMKLREAQEQLKFFLAKNAEMEQDRNWRIMKHMEMERELGATREQLQIFVAKNAEMTLNRQTDTKKKLSEIETLLLIKHPKYKSTCRIENNSLNEEENIFRDIKALIEYDLQSVKSASEANSWSGFLKVSEYEIHLVTLIATCLKVTPFPVNSNYVYSYVANIDNAVDLQYVENLLKKFPSFFKEVAVAPGSSDKNWTYLDLKPVITI